jgi:ABC-type bacteriocin/lantibiotic exporter with double-glycine peptidase domain
MHEVLNDRSEEDPDRTIELERIAGHVEFQDVTFEYERQAGIARHRLRCATGNE